jgi:anthranilate phosphoribosyltransferase
MSQTANQILETLLNGKDIGEDSAYNLMIELAEGVVAPPLAGALLTALRLKGESAEEVRGFARAMRDVAIPVSLDPEQATIDIVGTGGDGSNSFNLSTGTALLSAAAWLKVAKHGNRSVSSKSGSADVLEALGITLAADAAAVIDLLNKHNFAFLFAPFFHPAMKNIAPIRQALGIRTVFNILGP